MLPEKYLIGLDLGTSAIKGILMSAEGHIISRENEKTEYRYPFEGQVEFDAERFYSSAAGVIKRLAAAAPENGMISGLSMASASGNTVLLDTEMKPLNPCISWMDARASGEVEQVFGKLSPREVHDIVGWPLGKKFPLNQLSWLKCHRPELLQSSAKICMSTDYLNYRLTGKWGIDESTATTFFLRDQRTGLWYEPFLNSLDIPEWKLPRIYPSGSLLGTITEEAAQDTGLLPGTPVVLGAFDHPCAARGTGVMKKGQMLISCGTSWVCFYPMAERQQAIALGMLVDPFLSPDGPWGAMVSLPAVATAIDKYICKYISSHSTRYSEFDRLANLSEPRPEGLFINPLHETEPYNIKDFSKAEIARALMEGTAFLLKMRMKKLESSGTKAVSAIMVGGPSETEPWPQILCNILGISLTSMNGSCAGAAGAAILAGIGAGLFRNEVDAFNRLDFPGSIHHPDNEMKIIYDKMYHKFINV